MSYIQLNGDDTEGSQEEFSVKVLYRESTYIINNITTATTVQQLKSKIAETTNVPISQQRLIFNGKSLQDNNTLNTVHAIYLSRLDCCWMLLITVRCNVLNSYAQHSIERYNEFRYLQYVNQ